MTFPKSDNVENDLQKASLEVIHLREEESKLRHENLQLKVSGIDIGAFIYKHNLRKFVAEIQHQSRAGTGR